MGYSSFGPQVTPSKGTKKAPLKADDPRNVLADQTFVGDAPNAEKGHLVTLFGRENL